MRQREGQLRLFEAACPGAVMGGRGLMRPGRAAAVYEDARLRARLSEVRWPVPCEPVAPAPSEAYESAAPRDGRGLLAEHVRAARSMERTARRILAAIPSRSRAEIERAVWSDWQEYVGAFDPAADPRGPELEPLFLDRCLAEALRRHGGEEALESALAGP